MYPLAIASVIDFGWLPRQVVFKFDRKLSQFLGAKPPLARLLTRKPVLFGERKGLHLILGLSRSFRVSCLALGPVPGASRFKTFHF
jgi:hypothetical protein